MNVNRIGRIKWVEKSLFFYKLADVSEDKIYIVDKKKSTAILTAL